MPDHRRICDRAPALSCGGDWREGPRPNDPPSNRPPLSPCATMVSGLRRSSAALLQRPPSRLLYPSLLGFVRLDSVRLPRSSSCFSSILALAIPFYRDLTGLPLSERCEMSHVARLPVNVGSKHLRNFAFLKCFRGYFDAFCPCTAGRPVALSPRFRGVPSLKPMLP